MMEFKHKLSDETKSVELCNFETVRLVTRPIMDWSERTLYGKSYTNCK